MQNYFTLKARKKPLCDVFWLYKVLKIFHLIFFLVYEAKYFAQGIIQCFNSI